MSKKPVMLCIMDGFGWTPDEDVYKRQDDENYAGKRVLVRCDFNVPMKDGVITNDNPVSYTHLQSAGLSPKTAHGTWNTVPMLTRTAQMCIRDRDKANYRPEAGRRF